MKAGNPEKYKGLEISKAAKWLLICDNEMFRSFCNGVGSKVGFFAKIIWHLTPNTIWFMDITDCSDLHDVDYSIPFTFQTKKEALIYKNLADKRFYNNLMIRIKERGGIFEKFRSIRAMSYYKILSSCGEESFLEGKKIKDQV